MSESAMEHSVMNDHVQKNIADINTIFGNVQDLRDEDKSIKQYIDE